MKSQVHEFLVATGNDFPEYDNLDKEYLTNKTSKIVHLLSEEVQELIDAVVDEDVTELADAVADIGVYYTQLVLLLERAGVNYQGVTEAVCQNNSAKYTTSTGLATKWIEEAVIDGRDVYLSTEEYEGTVYFCLKDKSTHKVMKPRGFEKVKLDQFVPEKFK